MKRQDVFKKGVSSTVIGQLRSFSYFKSKEKEVYS